MKNLLIHRVSSMDNTMIILYLKFSISLGVIKMKYSSTDKPLESIMTQSTRHKGTKQIAKSMKPMDPTPTLTSVPANLIEVGDLVSIASNATYWDGAIIPNWIKNQKWYVYSVGSNDRIVINQNEKKTNTIMSSIDKKYLTVISINEFQSYKVKVIVGALNYRTGAGIEHEVNGTITDRGIYTIVAEAQDSKGYTWGKLESGAGWINLQYTEKI